MTSKPAKHLVHTLNAAVKEVVDYEKGAERDVDPYLFLVEIRKAVERAVATFSQAQGQLDREEKSSEDTFLRRMEALFFEVDEWFEGDPVGERTSLEMLRHCTGTIKDAMEKFDKWPDPNTTEEWLKSQYREGAFEIFEGDTRLEFDETPKVRMDGDSGAYVQAWAYVPDHAANIKDETT